MHTTQTTNDHLRRGTPTLLLTLVLGLGLLMGCEPLGLNGGGGPSVELSTQTVSGNSTVVDGDTIIFRRIEDREKAPCHFFKPSCELPPIPLEGGAGFIHLKKGYFLTPSRPVPLRGAVQQRKQEIEIRIWPDYDAVETVASMPEPFTYEAWVRGLSSGTYEVQMVHERDALRVLHGSLQVGDDDSRAIVARDTVTVE